jgi:hypothetical protein
MNSRCNTSCEDTGNTGVFKGYATIHVGNLLEDFQPFSGFRSVEHLSHRAMDAQCSRTV